MSEPKKKTYKAPVLRELGDFSTVTRGADSGGADTIVAGSPPV